MLAFGDLSLMVKAGVQWGLFGGALQMLGNRGQHELYLRDVMSFDLPGCFAMTETGHGSDVQQLRTTCTYDPATRPSTCTPRTRPRARTTSATRPRTAGWRSPSRSSSPG